MSLDTLLRRTDIWRGRQHAPGETAHGVPTGFAALDARLPGGGWPSGALSELFAEQEGIGELQLLMPALARLTREGHWIAWVGPPHIPYAPALAHAGLDLGRLLVIQAAPLRDTLWAMEQALRSGACRALLGWPGRDTDERQLRRLQLAAEEHNALAFLFRDGHAANRPSPAALRLRVSAGNRGPRVEILKCRGSWQRGVLNLAIAS